MPLTRRQVFRRRRIVVFGGAALVLAAGFYLPFTLLAPLHSVAGDVLPYQGPPVAEPALEFPGYGAAGIGALDYPGVLASAGTPDALPIASITKVITALVVLDAHPLAVGEAGPDLTFSAIDEQFYADQVAQGGSVQTVYTGQVMSQRTILTVLLLASANNYAQSLATWAFGSEAAFLAAARAWLDREGLAATIVTDPSGILPSNVSPVGDLVQLAKLALRNPVIAEIVATPTADVPEIGVIENRNDLLGIDGVDGIKTGTLDEAGSCLLFSADRTVGAQTVTLVGVLLGGPDHPTIDAAIQALLGQAISGFHEVELASVGESFATYDTVWGDDSAAVAQRSLSVAIWSASAVGTSIAVDEVRLATAGTPVGAVTFTVGERILTVPLQLSETIDDPGPWWRLMNPAKLF